jgi:hypothetical protein
MEAPEGVFVTRRWCAPYRGLRRARDEFNQSDHVQSGMEPPFEYGLICTAMRMFDENYSKYFRDLCRQVKREAARLGQARGESIQCGLGC